MPLPLPISEYAQHPLGWMPPHAVQRHVSDTGLSETEFARYQRFTAPQTLTELVHECRRRFLYAHRLIHPARREPDCARNQSEDHLAPLYLPWDMICVLYRRHRFTPQLDLFLDQGQRERDRWRAFIDRYCFAPFLQDPTWTRALLEAVGMIEPGRANTGDTLENLFEFLIEDLEGRIAHE